MNSPRASLLILIYVLAIAPYALAGEVPVHGLWVWRTPSVLAAPDASKALRDFCRSEGINEVYVSISAKDTEADMTRLAALIGELHQSGIRVEALYGSDDGDKPGKPREALLARVRAIVEFNRSHLSSRFDGIHLDIEPHQRPENKGAGNLKFLPDLTETLREVNALAQPAGLMVNADIPNKLLKGDLDERKMLFTAVPRLSLMLYEIASPNDGKNVSQEKEKMLKLSEKYMAMAYEGLTDPGLAKMEIALRAPDYGDRLPEMLKTLDPAFESNPHYLGWARHAYNDWLDAQRR